ncbi:hypothetical protein [Parasutterella muris]|uniref:Tetratricopeptide repeat protein n=1 Tax=Parasutterella muris TaxID=2565572 RepID=A0A6L6YI18_9BURK|nr:hypothetical protein [Parasutterella muris]MVX56492.1 tetratricopeptide repeat protein [Parasutterella muris]
MFTLTLLMAAASVFTAAVFIYCFKKQNAGRISFSILLLTGVILIAASALYAGLGRFSDWQDAKVETHIDPRLAAKITEARREVLRFPDSADKKIELGRLLLQGGRFSDSAQVFEQAIAQYPQRADLYGLKARALYYANGRKITDDVRESIDAARALKPAEAESTMLVAEDAYRRGEYRVAVEEWQKVLKSGSAGINREAVANAVRSAQTKLQKSEQQ